MLQIDLISIFPDYLSPLKLSLLGKAQDKGIVSINIHDLREQTNDVHHSVDDTPYGGGAGMVLAYLAPVSAGDVINLQGSRRCLRGLRLLLDALLFGALYRLSFSAIRALRRAEKATISPLEVVLVVRRFRGEVDGHGTSLRVWRSMKSSISGSVNILRGRFVPHPTMT